MGSMAHSTVFACKGEILRRLGGYSVCLAVRSSQDRCIWRLKGGTNFALHIERVTGYGSWNNWRIYTCWNLSGEPFGHEPKAKAPSIMHFFILRAPQTAGREAPSSSFPRFLLTRYLCTFPNPRLETTPYYPVRSIDQQANSSIRASRLHSRTGENRRETPGTVPGNRKVPPSQAPKSHDSDIPPPRREAHQGHDDASYTKMPSPPHQNRIPWHS